MRLFFFLLLLANIALAAYMELRQSNLSAAPPQLHPEQIKLIVAQTAATRAVQPFRSTVTAASPAACLEWGIFTGNDLQRAEAALATLNLGDKISQRVSGEVIAYWVHIPPLNSRQAAEKKISELTRLGVSKYHHIQDNSKWNNAISLEMFVHEETAKKVLAELRLKKIKSAIIGERTLNQVLLVISEPPKHITEKLVELKQAFPGSELKAAQCT